MRGLVLSRPGPARPLLILALLLLGGGPSAATSPARQKETIVPVRVVVNPDVAGSRIKRELLAQIFLKEALRWGKGPRIVVVDQSLRSEAREQFSRLVLGQSRHEVLRHWRLQIERSEGRRPPKVLESDEAVLRFVAAEAGAVGYVSADAKVDEKLVKLMTVIE